MRDGRPDVDYRHRLIEGYNTLRWVWENPGTVVRLTIASAGLLILSMLLHIWKGLNGVVARE